MSTKLALATEESPVGYNTAKALVPRSLDEIWRAAGMLASARGFIPRDMVDNRAMIAAAIMTGAELGLGPMQSIRGIHIVEGRPQLSAELMLSLALQAGVRVKWIKTTAKEAHIALRRVGHDPFDLAFTWDEAVKAGLVGTGKTSKGAPNMWSKYPSAMLRARCLSAAMRAYCPDVLGAGVYVEGELVEEDEAPGARLDVVDSEPERPEVRESDTIDVDGEKPAKLLKDCATAEELRAWCAAEGQAAMDAVGPKRVEKSVVQHAKTLGVDAAIAASWLTGEAPEDIVAPPEDGPWPEDEP